MRPGIPHLAPADSAAAHVRTARVRGQWWNEPLQVTLLPSLSVHLCTPELREDPPP